MALKKDGERVKVKKYPIDRHNFQIDTAIEQCEDEYSDVCDIYNTIACCLSDRSFDYCLAHEYTDTYIKDINPIKFDPQKYKENNCKIFNLRVNNKIKRLPKYQRYDIDKIKEIEEEVNRLFYSTDIKPDKQEFLKRVLPYIYASDYYDALNYYNIEKDCIAYSSEKHGDNRSTHKIGYHTEYKVNDDIYITIKTNFCYGNSTYFCVIVSYKGIEILPYSIWVNYYYAGYSLLLKNTRSFLRTRNSWHHCMDFLANFINSAIDNPESFIHNEVMQEVNGLLLGLEKIFNLNETNFEDKIIIQKHSEDNRYIGIIGVRHANESDEEEYKMAPKEISMIYRMEKISGALRFLDNLRKFNDIYNDITDAINRIIDMNQKIYPEIESAIPPVENEIKELNIELSPLNRRLNNCETSYKKLQAKLDKNIQNITDNDRIKAITEFFDKKYHFKELGEEIKNLNNKISIIKQKIYKRERFVYRLNEYKNLIIKYAKPSVKSNSIE